MPPRRRSASRPGDDDIDDSHAIASRPHVDDRPRRPLIPPHPPAPRVREGPRVARSSSPAWDLTHVRVTRDAKERFELWRISLSRDGRVLPHWEAFDALLDEAEVDGADLTAPSR